MKKFLIWTGAIVAVLAIGTYVFLQFFLGSMVQSGVEKRGTRLTQTKVAVRTASLSPLSGRGTLWGFAVANPKGWSDRDVFSIGIVHVEMAPFSVFDDHILIHEIVIDSPQFNFESGVLSSNISDLLKNIKDSTDSGKKDPSEDASAGHHVKLEVQHLVIRKAVVSVGLGPAATTMEMPDVELNDIGTKEGGVTPAQLALAIMHSVTPSVLAVTTHTVLHIVPTLGNAAGNTVKKTGEVIKGIFEDKDKK